MLSQTLGRAVPPDLYISNPGVCHLIFIPLLGDGPFHKCADSLMPTRAPWATRMLRPSGFQGSPEGQPH